MNPLLHWLCAIAPMALLLVAIAVLKLPVPKAAALGAAAAAALAAACLRVSGAEWACLLLAMGMVTAAEALNTAIERLCDFVEEGRNPQIGMIKDIAAGAVLLAALFAAAVGAAVFLPRILGCVEALQRYV